ncbi:E3 ubiquitin-protein ligase Topors-like [Orbicella faveolata]|uniref:E3 ubiquitin-protein ligase Topors-like n=1 Tax=Orbicella faveolata TaxID=48498 RepID=UPI0009E3FF9A|nr:E3 ubiquitin-protein ligase Topors-like [Orbicella faveolata]
MDMEGKLNDLPETKNDVGTIEASTKKPSKTQLVEYDSDSNSPRSTQPESHTRSISQEVVELSSDDDVQIIDVKGQKGTETLEKGHEQHTGRSSPKDLTCSVCLSEYDNKAFLDKCFHAFCYFCILQWSEIVRTCPLCKSSFSSIIHSVKSMDNYQQHYLSKPDVHAPMIQQQSQSDGRRFRYRTTLAEGNRQRQQRQSQGQQVDETDPWEQRARRRQAHIAAQRDRKAIGRERRRTIYCNNLWVQGVTQEGRARQREICKLQCTEKNLPLIHAIKLLHLFSPRVELSSDEFHLQLQPFLFDKTEHFIHEFTSFARSPFDMTAYDERAQYNRPNESRDQVRDTPTVFHSQTSGWQTPVPGPSGESILEVLETDWSRDSPVLQRESTSWSPSSSPGTSGLNGQLSLAEIVTISSASSHTVWTNAERPGIDEPANGAAHSTGSRNRTRSKSESVTEETQEKSRHHYHRHSHKHKHKHKHKPKQKDSKRHKTERSISEQSQVTESLDNGLDHSGSKDESSVSGTPPVEVIVVSSDSNTSPSASRLHNRASPIDLTVLRRKTERSVSRSRSRSKSVAKGKRILHDESRSGHAESRFSRDRSRSTGERTRKGSHRSRSRSPSRLKERHRSKGKRRLEIDDHDMSKSELLSSKKQSLKKEKHHREKKRSRSCSSGRSRSQSKAKSASKTRSEKFDKRTVEYSRSRTTSDSSKRNEAPSSSRSRRSLSRRSRSRSSRSPNSRSRNSRSRSRSRSKRFSRSHSSRSPRSHVDSSRGSRSHKSSQSRDHSDYNPKKLSSDSDEDIKKEIDDLEYRITTDKKRLLKLLIKQEREKAVDVTELDDEADEAGSW